MAQCDLKPTDDSITRVRSVIDENKDGIAERITVQLVDIHGRDAGVEFDVNGDGVVDYRTDILRDQEGRLRLLTTDINADGAADSIECRIYRSAQISVHLDVDGDGVFDKERVLKQR